MNYRNLKRKKKLRTDKRNILLREIKKKVEEVIRKQSFNWKLEDQKEKKNEKNLRKSRKNCIFFGSVVHFWINSWMVFVLCTHSSYGPFLLFLSFRKTKKKVQFFPKFQWNNFFFDSKSSKAEHENKKEKKLTRQTVLFSRGELYFNISDKFLLCFHRERQIYSNSKNLYTLWHIKTKLYNLDALKHRSTTRHDKIFWKEAG